MAGERPRRSFCNRLPDFEVPSSGGRLAHDLFLPKPVDRAQLLDKVRKRLESAA